VPVAQRRANAARQVTKLVKKGTAVEPVTLQGRQIARTFWGQAWCRHLESFSDFSNRLPRGRSYVRNGSVCHLTVAKGQIEALVSGSSLYRVTIAIKTLKRDAWADLKRRCAGQIASLLDLLQGRLSDGVMAVVTDRARGLFPQPGEISMQCSCPDWAVMCKHVAAVLYGVGARLDAAPALLFALRGVDHGELVQVETAALTAGKAKGLRLRTDDLGEMFGIDLVAQAAKPDAAPPTPPSRGKPMTKQRAPAKRPADRSRIAATTRPPATRGTKPRAVRKSVAPARKTRGPKNGVA
jgi:uncharacterized Zn finger protein